MRDDPHQKTVMKYNMLSFRLTALLWDHTNPNANSKIGKELNASKQQRQMVPDYEGTPQGDF